MAVVCPPFWAFEKLKHSENLLIGFRVIEDPTSAPSKIPFVVSLGLAGLSWRVPIPQSD